MKYRRLDGYKYELLDTEAVDTIIRDVEVSIPRNGDIRYICLWESGRLFVFPHYMWDGPSGPTLDTKTFMRGSLIHDALYQLMREGLLDRKYRKYTDQLLRRICIENGMARWRAWYVYHSVRTFGKKSSKPRKRPRGQIVET